MLTRKICLLGKFYVGKTSLVRRYVHAQFDDLYQTTVGVKIDTKTVETDDGELKLVVWDIQGSDDVLLAHSAYLNGASGFIVVADGTRPDTVDAALQLQQLIKTDHGNKPVCTLINKHDLESEWSLEEDQIDSLRQDDSPLLLTSAKTGENVEQAFTLLGQQLLSQ